MSCLQCPPGKYQTGLGSPDENYCIDCEAGKFQSLSGAFICTLCDAGKFSSAINVSSSLQCQSCSANFFSAAGSASCSADCPAGSFPGNAMQCEKCDSGKYLSYRGGKNRSECHLCSPGTYSTAVGVSSGNCILCASGKYQTGLGLIAEVNCTLCAAGKHQTGKGMHTFCCLPKYMMSTRVKGAFIYFTLSDMWGTNLIFVVYEVS